MSADLSVGRVFPDLTLPDHAGNERRLSQLAGDTVATRLAVLAAVNGLPRRQREVVALRYLADLSEAEVAACLGVATGTIKSHLHRGISTLRVQLGPNFEEAFLATA